jgi:predicted lipid-binding transport protein (Tim44 family)
MGSRTVFGRQAGGAPVAEAGWLVMQGSLDVFTLIFLALAVFVAWRLRSVLGTKTGHEKPPGEIFPRKAERPGDRAPDRPGDRPAQNEGNVVRLPTAAANDAAEPAFRWAGVTTPGSAVAAGLDAIAREERGFDAREFVAGASSAYEMIVMSFARGDRKTLKGLLSKEVFEDFDQAISERERRSETSETTFVSMDKAEIEAAEVRGKTAFVTVRFQPKLITVVRNNAGAVVDGSADTVLDVSETWTFSRQLGSRDPNWLLVATEAAD